MDYTWFVVDSNVYYGIVPRTSMTDTDIIRDPSYPVFKIGDEMIWDLTALDKSNISELLTSKAILEPTEKNEDHVSFCKGDFNIRALVYEKASPKDIVSAWSVVKDELKLNRLLESLS